MKAPVVSIVVPTYLRLHFLKQALASALCQTYRDFEIIVSDDSASNTISDYVRTLDDPRIRYQSNSSPLGIAGNCWSAFLSARGTYIASLHDDDIWEPEFLATLVPPLDRDTSLTVAFCDHHLIDENSQLLPKKTKANTRFFHRDKLKPGRHQPFLKPAVIDLTIPMAMGAVFRRSILSGIPCPESFGGCYDYWLSYLAVRDGQACFYVPQRLTRYRVHSQSGTALKGIRNLRESIRVRKAIMEDPKFAPYQRDLKQGIAVVYGKLAEKELSKGSYRRGWVLLQHALSQMNRPRNGAALIVKGLLSYLRSTKR